MSELPSRIGRFEILEKVGQGATATVYRAVSPDHPEGVAIKHVRFGQGDGEARRVRRLKKLLKAEAAVARRLEHPNIIRIDEVVFEDDAAHVVMEYFPGLPLARHCRFDNLLPLHRVMGIVFKCCMALDHAFRQGVVHRDIKPDNILVDAEDNVKITDFGLALNLDRKQQSDSTFIVGVGSPAYMSPEQIKSYPLNQKTDLYSLGVVLFHLLTGRLPFRANNHAQLIYKILNADPPSPSRLNPDLPQGVDAVVAKALEKDLYSRYRNGAQFAQDLSAIRYKIVDESQRPSDTRRFEVLRRLAFFTEFDDVELWEALRISAWRRVDAGVAVFRENDEDPRFALLIDGEVEISIDGRRVERLGPGSAFGELAWLDVGTSRQMTTAVTVVESIYLEVSPSALALASEEVRDKFRAVVGAIAARRCAEAMRAIAAGGEQALPARRAAPGRLDLQLVDD
ncbi:serine/threonine-protein kinase [Pseudazoarcus pumilus]|uniref:Serine/threonine protein kinase n=1 Tax=Pseudazoarcus pumilus TaxID=2067960 RepID=A0A2I6S665_9RHOO|nr:serine/threonine-protein kinase [Pseudazoarcus pumilus]AUN94752.1 serine/threonine protein kinase [Pseudazoarcus pumilus]